jgi:hypothetical protein
VEELAELWGSPDLNLLEHAQREEQAIVTYTATTSSPSIGASAPRDAITTGS